MSKAKHIQKALTPGGEGMRAVAADIADSKKLMRALVLHMAAFADEDKDFKLSVLEIAGLADDERGWALMHGVTTDFFQMASEWGRNKK